jgi:hypothetical protein
MTILKHLYTLLITSLLVLMWKSNIYIYIYIYIYCDMDGVTGGGSRELCGLAT